MLYVNRRLLSPTQFRPNAARRDVRVGPNRVSSPQASDRLGGLGKMPSSFWGGFIYIYIYSIAFIYMVHVPRHLSLFRYDGKIKHLKEKTLVNKQHVDY